MRRLVVAAALVLLGGVAHAADPDVRVTNYGTYITSGESTEPDMTMPNLQRGHFTQWRFTETTYDICARIGVNFGFEVRPRASAPTGGWQIQVTTDHPPIHGVDGKIHMTEHYATALHGGKSVFGWSFHHANALVAGDWTFTLTYGDLIVARRTFHLDTHCGAPIA